MAQCVISYDCLHSAASYLITDHGLYNCGSLIAYVRPVTQLKFR